METALIILALGSFIIYLISRVYKTHQKYLDLKDDFVAFIMNVEDELSEDNKKYADRLMDEMMKDYGKE
ncbi:MAG TPA: hypothetical protein PKW33_15435 [Anaerolineaceae bacterium]|nr:hypothetical protein [Anaerolineaceae bacterium]HPN52987.1 hypothetical protein [Anaerolineaceae bacterium]